MLTRDCAHYLLQSCARFVSGMYSCGVLARPFRRTACMRSSSVLEQAISWHAELLAGVESAYGSNSSLFGDQNLRIKEKNIILNLCLMS